MRELDRSLLQQLSRLKAPDCPSEEALGNFLDGKGSPEERQSLEGHLQGCPSCVNRLIDLRELALWEQAGEKPPRALVNELKRLVPARESVKRSVLPALGWIAESLSAAWEAVWRWTSPRFLGEVVAAAAVAVFIVFAVPTLLRQQPPSSPRGKEQIKAVADLSAAEQSILQSLSAAPAGPEPLQKQLVATLEQLPKNLLLEQTRGTTNVEVYKKAAPATVLVVTDQGLGSGAVISSRGEVLTNWHVIQGASRVVVVFKPPRGAEVKKELAFAATLIKVDQVADLALLKILAPPPNLSVLPLGDMAEVEVGQDVHAIGHPDGEVWTYTTGIISQVRPNYRWTGSDGLLHQSEVIQTQTALNPGNSGGPLLNDQGQLIGINSFRREGEGLNYAVGVNVVKAFLQRAESRAAAPAPSPRASAYRMERYGTKIVGVYVNARVPPPDVWLVYDGANGQLAYAAMGDTRATQIDTVIRPDLRSESLVYYFDLDCDGKIDLIGYQAEGDDTIERYDLPQEPLQIASLARELIQAFQQGIIPYPQLRICR